MKSEKMLKEILKLLNENNRTFSEIANDLGISSTVLRDRIEMLVHLGYLRKIESCEINSDIKSADRNQNKRTGAVRNCCKYCVLFKSCTENVEPLSGAGEFIGYELTEKGRKGFQNEF